VVSKWHGNGRRGWKSHVLITTSCDSMPYFLAKRTLRIVASRPFNADMLSANLQLIGMLGASEPTYLTLAAYFWASAGMAFEIKGFCIMPSSKSFWDWKGTEYVSGVNLSLMALILPIVTMLGEVKTAEWAGEMYYATLRSGTTKQRNMWTFRTHFIPTKPLH